MTTSIKAELLALCWSGVCKHNAVIFPGTNSPKGQLVQCAEKLQKTQQLHHRLYSPQIIHYHWMLAFMTAQFKKDWTTVACVEGLPGESLSSLRTYTTRQHDWGFHSCIWTYHKTNVKLEWIKTTPYKRMEQNSSMMMWEIDKIIQKTITYCW